MWNLQPTLTHGRVTLEPLAEDHREPLWQAAQPAEIWEFWTLTPSSSREHWDWWFDRCLAGPEQHDEHHFATVADGVPVGATCYCDVDPEWRSLEIGWTWLTSSVWGAQVNTAAKYLQMRYAFEELGCFRVKWDTAADNQRSRAALTRLGASFEGVMRDAWVKQPGTIRMSSAIYSMLDHEWPDARAALEARLNAPADAPS